MNNKLITIIVIIILVIAGIFLFRDQSVAPVDVVDDAALETETVPTATDQVEAEAEVKEFSVDGVPFSFSLSSIEVNQGDTVKITFRNVEGTHDFKIDEFAGASTRILKSGEEQTITFVADKVGDFEYYCSVGNHRALGMKGTLTVR